MYLVEVTGVKTMFRLLQCKCVSLTTNIHSLKMYWFDEINSLSSGFSVGRRVGKSRNGNSQGSRAKVFGYLKKVDITVWRSRVLHLTSKVPIKWLNGGLFWKLKISLIFCSKIICFTRAAGRQIFIHYIRIE